MCKWVVRIFMFLYLAALALFLIPRFGLFGQSPDAFDGIFLVFLGWPWDPLIDLAPEPSWPWLMAAAPILNILLLSLVCRLFALIRR